MKGAQQQTTAPGEPSGKLLADRWGLEYREAHTLSIDPSALAIVDGAESRRLGVLPLEIGEDGPVFAVAEPNEERFAAVRALAGENATFVVVAQETLDALLNSKVFAVDSTSRRPSLFRSRSETTAPPPPAPDRPAREAEERPQPQAPADPSVGAAVVPQPADALDNLLSQITTGTGHLRAQVEELTESLAASQRELREAKEELARAHRERDAHDEVVVGLRTETESLKAALDRSNTLNESMTARLQEVVRALSGPGKAPGGDPAAARPGTPDPRDG